MEEIKPVFTEKKDLIFVRIIIKSTFWIFRTIRFLIQGAQSTFHVEWNGFSPHELKAIDWDLDGRN